MRVLFIDPIKTGPRKPRASGVSVPDVALATMSACLMRKGHTAAVIDSSAENPSIDDIVSRTREFNPDIVGMPLFTYKMPGAGEIAGRIKNANPAIRIVVGGAHVTALPERTMRERPEFEFAAIGEGEHTLLQLVDGLENGSTDFSTVDGLAWRRGDEVVVNRRRASIENLDELPFPEWSLFPLDRYTPMYTNKKFLELPVSSSRGCEARCSFCFRLSRGTARRRSPANVVEEIERDIKDFGARSVMFVDEAFTSDPNRTREICELMTGRQLPGKLRWICQTRITMIDRELASLMKKAGCSHVSCGIESGSQEILDRNNKGIKLEDARESIRQAKAAGLQVDANYILGLPWETQETMVETLAFSRSTKADYASFFIFTPYPGTAAMELAREGKARLKLVSENWADYEIQTGGAVELEGIPRKQLERFQLLCYLAFYMRVAKIGKLLNMIGIKSIPSILLKIAGGKW